MSVEAATSYLLAGIKTCALPRSNKLSVRAQAVAAPTQEKTNYGVFRLSYDVKNE